MPLDFNSFRREMHIPLDPVAVDELRKFVRSAYADFVLNRLSDFNASRNGKAAFTCSELAMYFDWKSNICERFLNALVESGLCKKSLQAETSAYDLHVDTQAHMKDSAISSWLAEPAPSGGSHVPFIDAAVAELRAAGGLLPLYQHYPETFKGLDELDGLYFYKYIVGRVLNLESIESALKTGVGVSAEAFDLPSNRHFDHYEQSDDLMALHAVSFGLSNVEANLQLAESLSDFGSSSVLDLGGGVGQIAAAILLKSQNPISVTAIDHPSSENSLAELRRVFCGVHSSQINWAFEDITSDSPCVLSLGLDKKFDCIVLGWILHDWDDATCLKILRKAAHHLAPGGRVIVLEKPMASDRIAGATYDFMMLLLASGLERTIDEYD